MNTRAKIPQHSRRDFLVESAKTASSGWFALRLAGAAGLVACGPRDRRTADVFQVLTEAEARTMRAFAAQIIPSSDGSPGADEARAVHFIDAALKLPLFAGSVAGIRTGLADLDARARELGARAGFGALATRDQVDIMRQIERTPFFAAARTLAVMGTLADPSHGGNAGEVGWTLIGMEHRAAYTAPFGWYDGQERHPEDLGR